MNPDCRFILIGDYNDCANAGGGRGAKDGWCDSCVRKVVSDLLADTLVKRNALGWTQRPSVAAAHKFLASASRSDAPAPGPGPGVS